MDPDRKLVAEGAAHIERAQKDWLKKRNPMLLAIAVGAIAVLSLTSLPAWRIAGVACVFAAMIVAAQVIYLRWLGVGHSAKRQLTTVFPIGFAAALLNILLTGGLNSPFIVLAMAPLIAFSLVAETRALRFILAVLACAVAGYLLLPLSFTTGLFTPVEFRMVQAFSVITFAVVVVLTLIQNRRLVNDMNVALERARGDLLQAAAERKRALEMLGAKVAHELRNPLAAMKALVALESRNPGGQKSAARLEVVLGEIARMEQILRDYLSSSRPLEDLELAPVQLETIADEAVSVLEGRASEHGVALRRLGKGKVIQGDARRLKETLLNLASNAIDATPRGGKVEIMLEESDGGARVLVRDEGRGMDAATLARLGTPFFTTRENGTGLGVVIARSIVQQHGGALTYESRPDGGTIATIQLPALNAPADRGALRRA